MPRNGSGTMTITNGVHSGSTTFEQDRDAGTNILAQRIDYCYQDIGDEITNSIACDGQSVITENIPFNSKRITGLANGAAAQDAATIAQLQNSATIWGGTSTGASGIYAIGLTPAITAYTTGQKVAFRTHQAGNASGNTLNVDGVGAFPLVYQDTTSTAKAELVSGQILECVYYNMTWVITNAQEPVFTVTAPTIAYPGGGATITTNFNNFIYTAIGNFVWFNHELSITTDATGSAPVISVTLPITANATYHPRFKNQFNKYVEDVSTYYDYYWEIPSTDAIYYVPVTGAIASNHDYRFTTQGFYVR